MYAVLTNNLTKKYKEKIAVNTLNLKIKQGELFSLLGVNGAGKTTTIKMLSCLCKPTTGEALLLGDSITNNQLKVKEKIGVSPQETAIAPNLSIAENLEFICGINGFSKKEIKAKTSHLIKELGMSDIAKTKAKTLSGGWQRRLSIAMALISNPQILFLDEPTLGLDVIARRELWNYIKRLKNKITIILTTHYMEEAENLSDRIGIMSNGNLVAVGTSDELIAQTNTQNLEDAFIRLSTNGGVQL